MKKPIRIACGLTAGCLLLTVPALAAPPAAPPGHTAAAPKASVAALFASGEAKYKTADYAAALADFTAADEQKPSAETARYVALCEDKLGHYRAAATAYNRFLAHPGAKRADEVGPTVARVRELEQMAGTVRIDVLPPGASLTIDGAPERSTAPYEAHMDPGKHLIRASAPEYEALEREVNVTFASVQDVTLTLTAAPLPPVTPAPSPVFVPPPPAAPVAHVVVVPIEPPPAPVTRRTVAFVAAGIAVIGAGLATSSGVLALNNKSDWERNPTFANSDKGNNDAAYADGAIALTVAAGVTSLVLFLTDDSAGAKPEPPHTATFSASPFLTPHGGGGGALVHF